MYMDGIGVQKKTRHLTDIVWDNLLYGIFGLWIALCGPLLSWAFLIQKFPWESPPTDFDLGAAAATASIAVAIGLKMFWRYFRAMRALKKHTQNMEDETERRGPGWGRS